MQRFIFGLIGWGGCEGGAGDVNTFGAADYEVGRADIASLEEGGGGVAFCEEEACSGGDDGKGFLGSAGANETPGFRVRGQIVSAER